MTEVSIIYFAVLGAAALAGLVLRNRRTVSTVLTVAALAGLGYWYGGDEVVYVFAVITVILAVVGAASYAFRALLIAISPEGLARELRTAPITAAFGMLVIFLTLLLMIFADVVAPYGEEQVISGVQRLSNPSDAHFLGTDQISRDIWSRIIYGARNSVGIALAATGIAFFLGAMAGLFAALRGGWMDQLLGRTADLLMSMPSLIFALLMLAIFGTSTWVIILVVAVVYSPRVFRLTRAVAGNIVVMDYIEAAKLRGESSWYLMRREILPNARAPLVAEFGLEFCFVFLLISGLAFLGLGLQPPAAHWGSMVKDLSKTVAQGKPLAFFPAAAIALLTVAVNFVVDWMLHRSSGLKD